MPISFSIFLSVEFIHLVFAGTLGATLARHRSNPRVYIGCMKSGPVLARKWAERSSNYFFQLVIFAVLSLTLFVYQQGSEISWARVLEIWRGREQIFPSCHWTALCYLKRLGYLHINQPVCFHILYGGNLSAQSTFTYFLHYANHVGMCYTSMPMRMFLWGHGSLDWMWSRLMTGDYVVEHHLVISYASILSHFLLTIWVLMRIAMALVLGKEILVSKNLINLGCCTYPIFNIVFQLFRLPMDHQDIVLLFRLL